MHNYLTVLAIVNSKLPVITKKIACICHMHTPQMNPFERFDLFNYACQELLVSFAVSNKAGLSNFSLPTLITVYGGEAISNSHMNTTGPLVIIFIWPAHYKTLVRSSLYWSDYCGMFMVTDTIVTPLLIGRSSHYSLYSYVHVIILRIMCIKEAMPN